MTTLLKPHGIRRNYPSGDDSVEVLKGITLSISAGKMVAAVGTSGSGKSTLTSILGCLDKPTSGTYRVTGTDIAQLNDGALARLRRKHFSFTFQRCHLLLRLTATQNAKVPAMYADNERQARLARAHDLLVHLGLGDRADYQPPQLSGSQQQRVSIARALMNDGEMILAGEPTGALNSHSGEEVMAILHQLEAQDHTIIIVTHGPQVTAQAERIIEIRNDEIVRNPPGSHQGGGLHARQQPEPSAWRQFTSGFREALVMAWRAMATNRVRTLLAIFGIIIGIASVVSIVVVGDAAKQMVLADIRAIGIDAVDVYPGRDFGDDDPRYQQALKYDDLLAIQKQSQVRSTTSAVSRSLRLHANDIDVAASAEGVGPRYSNVYDMTFNEDNIFSELQLNSRAQVVVLGNNTRRQLFPNKVKVMGEVILVNNMPITVVDVVDGKQSMFGSSKALHVWSLYTTMAGRVTGQSWLNSITVRVHEGYDSETAEKRLLRLLELRHGKKDVFTWNTDSILKTAEGTTHALQPFLILVVVIVLVVGDTGVINIMLVSVTEQTRGIGIRMTVGARASDVLQQFLIEAVLACLIGGVLGVTLSLMIAFILQLLLPGWEIGFSLLALLTASLCSMLTGVLFGWLSARDAVRLDPVDALAREQK